MGRRVLVAVHGSAGDLFPLVPLITRLRAGGYDVRCVLPRPLPLELRRHGIPVWSLGRGAKLHGHDGSAVVTTRFDGWDSLRRLTQRYASRALADDVVSVEQFLDTWTPDLVVSSTFAASTRIAAHRRRIDQLGVCVCPAMVMRARQATRFASGYRMLCARLAGLTDDQASTELGSYLAWGAGEGTLVLHDPQLLARSELADADLGMRRDGPTSPVGFPYWDDALRRQLDVTAAERWLGRSGPPAVAVTLGSYLGARRDDVRTEVAQAVHALGLRALFLGPRHARGNGSDGMGADCLSVGFVPLSRIAGRVAAIVHHGGVGTMFAALRAGRPAVVVPQAFDQPFNGRLVEGAGAGLVSSPEGLRQALEQVLADDSFTKRAGAVATTLVASEVAADRAVQQIVARL